MIVEVISSVTVSILFRTKLNKMGVCSLQNVVVTALTVLLMAVFYYLLCIKTSNIPILFMCKELLALSIASLIIAVPVIILTNNLSLVESNAMVIVFMQFVVIAIIAIITCYIILKNELKTQRAMYEAEIAKKELNYYDSITEATEELHKLRHDTKNHMGAIMRLLELEQYDMAKKYTQGLWGKLDKPCTIVLLDDKLLSVILTSKFQQAMQEGIKVAHYTLVNQSFYDFMGQMKDSDKTALFSNILDNAIRASAESEAKLLKFRIQSGTGDKFLIKCENSFREIQTDNEHFISTKKEAGHGLGLKIIEDIVRKYDGYIDTKLYDNKFILYIQFGKKGFVNDIEAPLRFKESC